MNKISGIYLIKNIITNDFYIGSSKNIKQRWCVHKCVSTWNRYPNSLLYQAFQKYGLSNFSFEILEEYERSDLKFREQYYISKFKPSYNIYRALQTPEDLKQSHRMAAKKWNKANHTHRMNYKKKWRELHKEHCKEFNKKWYQAHKEQRCEYQRQYRAKKKAVPET